MSDHFDEYEYLQLDEDDYLTDSRDFFICYTDGSSFGNHRKGQRFSGCSTYWGPGRETSSESQSPYSDQNTNQRSEVRGVLHALRHAADCSMENIQIRCDSQYVVDSLNRYIFKWRTNGWQTCSGDEIKHVHIFQEINDLMSRFDNFEIVHVARNRDDGIRAADKLAKQAARRHQSIAQCNDEEFSDDEEDEYESEDESGYDDNEYGDNESEEENEYDDNESDDNEDEDMDYEEDYN